MNVLAPARAQRAKGDVDRAIHAAIDAYTHTPTSRYVLCRLVSHVRAHSDMLRAIGGNGRSNCTVCTELLRGLSALAEHRRQWLRDVEGWRAASTSPRDQFAALARYLMADKPVPAFMTNVWLAQPSGEAWQHQRWFKHMGAVGTIRGADTPFRMNKKQAYLFATSPAHYRVCDALRRAQGNDEATAAKPAYPAGPSRRRRKREIGNASRLAHKLYPRSAVRGFSHLAAGRNPSFDRYWTIRQLRSHRELCAEGEAMEHCVATYDGDCRRGASSIWTMRCDDVEGVHRRLTVEVLSRARLIHEALGLENRDATDEERDVLRLWANREGLKVASWI